MQANKPPRVNWPDHSSSIEGSSNRDAFLSSGFLFSLPTQRPNPETRAGMLSLRSSACKIQGSERLKVPWIEKAWCSLCNTQASCNSYLRPGLSAKVKDSDRGCACTYGEGSYNINKKATVPGNRILSDESTHQPSEGGSLDNNNSHGHVGITRTHQSEHVAHEDMMRARNRYNYISPVAGLDQAAPVADNVCTYDKLDDMDDDDILASIDVDRIVMEHYQSTNTPRGSASNNMSTPPGNKCNLNGMHETNLPQELSELCSHQCKLAFCQEAMVHLQELKDELIAVSNELLDGDGGEFNPEHSQELQTRRLHLKKQVQLLEEYMIRSSQDEERQRSHSMASTTAIQGHLPPMTPGSTYIMDNNRFQSQVYINNGAGNTDLSYSAAPYSCSDNPSTPLNSVWREYTPKVIDINYTEGSGDKKWSATNFPWTKDLEAKNRSKFGNRSFRPNQREIINATMSGNDVFVLMPTGGGKSLTYQLPALISEGLTLVVCPLVSLIQDQIMHLSQANIPATYLSAMEWSEQQKILRDLMSCRYKLLYVTPEKIAKSGSLSRLLDDLYSQGHLSRIVIDEAHCVSQWGHDFRPDYKGLGVLKQHFPKTPVLALTATATARVKEDVVQALGLENCIVFKQSFNRPNLRYFLRPKTKKCLEDIDNFIRTNHFKECGIIYCLSRMDCEKVAEKLRECGHRVSHYHGNMDPVDRTHIQQQWSKDKINIICATVAFGMGINKPDVRFVIHHSLPKSIEGYHQECGRAGRDGLPSSCLLYYQYSDYIRVRSMLTQGVVEQTVAPRGAHEQALKTHKENLLRMVSYCENDVDCRRLLQLIHFGERFDPSLCAKTCDNCLKELRWVEKDVSNIARQLVELVTRAGQSHSSSHILEVYRGSLSQNVKKQRHDALALHGAGKHLPKSDASRILHYLVTEGILIEDVKRSENIYGSISSVLKVNHLKANDLCSGKHNIILKFPTADKVSKMGNLDASLFLQINKSVQQQSDVDEKLASLLFEALSSLRAQIMEECNEGYNAYHIFKTDTLKEMSIRVPRTKEELLEINGIGKAKLKKYGDRVLATIEDFLSKHPNLRRNSSGGEHSEAAKKRRGFTASYAASNGDDDFDERTAQSKKRMAKTRSTKQGASVSDAASMVHGARCIDADLDGAESVDQELCSVQKPVASGRVLPKWAPAKAKGGSVPSANLFQEFGYVK